MSKAYEQAKAARAELTRQQQAKQQKSDDLQRRRDTAKGHAKGKK